MDESINIPMITTVMTIIIIAFITAFLYVFNMQSSLVEVSEAKKQEAMTNKDTDNYAQYINSEIQGSQLRSIIFNIHEQSPKLYIYMDNQKKNPITVEYTDTQIEMGYGGTLYTAENIRKFTSPVFIPPLSNFKCTSGNVDSGVITDLTFVYIKQGE